MICGALFGAFMTLWNIFLGLAVWTFASVPLGMLVGRAIDSGDRSSVPTSGTDEPWLNNAAWLGDASSMRR